MKTLIFSLIFLIFTFPSLFSNDASVSCATLKLFDAISKNSFEDVKSAISEDADLLAKNPSTNKTVLYEALKNYYKHTKKSLGLNAAGAILSSVGLLAAGGTAFFEAWVTYNQSKISCDFYGMLLTTIALFTATASSAAGLAKFLNSCIKIRKKAKDAFRIVTLIACNEIMKDKLSADMDSLNFIRSISPRFEMALLKNNQNFVH